MSRRRLLIALLGTLGTTAWAALPQRNLLVQWRVQTRGAESRQSTGVRQGGLVIDSRHGVSGGATIEWSTAQSSTSQDADGQVLVLNGARATLRLSQSQALTHWQWVASLSPTPQASGASRPGGQTWSPSVSLWPDTVWVERGQGVTVRPRWPGGQALVELELEAEVSSPSAEGQTQVRTTLGVPMDQWTTVARTGDQQQARDGAWHSATHDERAQAELQIRVRLP